MSIRVHLLRCILTAVLLLETAILGAQNAGRTEFGSIRRLSWSGDQYALKYEVQVEKEEGGKFKNVLRGFTQEPFIEFSLPPGKYRCRVIPYDFLNRPTRETEWASFEIRTAPVPAPEAEPEPIEYIEIEPVKYVEPEPVEDVEPDPQAEAQPEADSPLILRKGPDISLSAAWMPLMPIYGTSDNLLDEKLSLASVGLRFGITGSKQGFLDMGLEAAAAWHRIGTVSGTDQNVLDFAFNFLAQKHSPAQTIALMFRMGGGLTLLQSQPLFHVDMGVSVRWHALRHLFFEAGIDYAHLFMSDPDDSPIGFIQTGIGAGWRF